MSQQKVSEKVQETFFNKLLSVPSNNECADCKNKSPSWVSLEFGVFVCIRCSGVHRQLGPHITRVRSTRLDGWVQENMDIMGNVGNKIANTYYENKFTNNSRRPGPNSSMEECREFIDKKYIKKLWAPRDNQEPVKEYLKSLKTGEQPNFNYSPTKDQREGEADNIKAVRKRSLSLDKLQKEQQHQDLLTDDLLGGGPTGGSGSQNDFGDFNQAHAHSASPRNHHQEAKQDGGWNWDLANSNTSNNQNTPTNSSNLNNLYNNNAGQNGQQQQQQQQKTVDLKSLYGQPGGMSGIGGMVHNNFSMGTQGGWGQGQNQGAWGNQGMQGMQGGFQQGGFNMGGNMGGNMNQMGGFNNNFGGQQNMMNQQQMRYGMGGMGNMGGMQGMGGMQHNMGFQQGQMNNQFGNNQFQGGFGNNQFQKQQQNNAGFGWK